MKTTSTQVLNSEQPLTVNHHTKTSFMKKFLRNAFPLAIAFVIANLFLTQQSFSQTVVTNPTSPFTVPAGVTSIKVEVWGGGGGGGSANTDLLQTAFGGGGGGGGAYNVATFAVTPGQPILLLVGAAGTAGAIVQMEVLVVLLQLQVLMELFQQMAVVVVDEVTAANGTAGAAGTGGY